MSDDMKVANDTARTKLNEAMRKYRIDRLAKAFPSAELRAAADEALRRELEASVFQPLLCDEVIK